jgi:hypothetical protein
MILLMLFRTGTRTCVETRFLELRESEAQSILGISVLRLVYDISHEYEALFTQTGIYDDQVITTQSKMEQELR